MKYEEKTFEQLYQQYQDNFVDAVIENIENIDKPINVEITCVNESKKYKGTILAINRTSDSAYNIILKTNKGTIEPINYNHNNQYTYNFKIAEPTDRIVKRKVSRSPQASPKSRKYKHNNYSDN